MNIRDIARLADVTPGTVSKVLNNYPDISEATRQHVLKIIEENQYDPKAKARSARSGPESARVGLVVEAVYNPLYSVLEDTLSRDIHNSGYDIVSFHDNFYIQDKTEKLCELKAIAERDKWCGLVYIGGNFERVRQEEFDSLPCPAIFVNTALSCYTGSSSYSSVQVSHFETAYSQMRYLIEKGHRSICTVISSVIDDSVYGQRFSGYQAALGRSRLESNLEHVLESDYQCEKAYQRLLAHLRLHPEITAVCSETDIIVPGILRAIHDAGRTPGKDIEIISFDGLESMEYCIPSVTTFAQPARDMVRHIYYLLFALINKEQQHQHVTFRPVFMKRESC